jgi:hypothetical protein
MSTQDEFEDLEADNDQGPCLHCYLWAAIEQYHDDTGRIDPQTGEQVWESQFVICSLLEVVAQFIAAHPPSEHRRILTGAAKHLGQAVAEFHARGQHPRIGPNRKH